MISNLIEQYQFNKNKNIECLPEFYLAFKNKMEAIIQSKQDIDPDILDFSNPPYLAVGDIAIIDFKGMTVNTCSDLEAFFLGLVSLQDFCADLQAAVADESINQIVINFDSGGGYTMYGEETCELIQELAQVKPILAYSSGYMCSMAYKIASCCTAVVASPSAWVGSINTYCQILTQIGASELSADGVTESTIPDLGVIVTTFQGGTEKTIGNEFIALSDDQKTLIQSDLLQAVAAFKAIVVGNRGEIDDKFMQGSPYTGKEAMELETNLIDGTVNSLSEFVQLISN